jgi:hypothetical protein
MSGDASTHLEHRQAIIDSGLFTTEQSISQYRPTLIQSSAQRDYFKELKETSSIVSTKTGYVHFENNISRGMVLSQSTVLFSVSDRIVGDNAEIRMYVPSMYRPQIDLEDRVQINVAGYPQHKFGHINGRVIEISGDSTIDQNGNALFLVKVSLDETTLTDDQGNSFSVTNGMVVDVAIEYEESTWLDWFLRKMGVFN